MPRPGSPWNPRTVSGGRTGGSDQGPFDRPTLLFQFPPGESFTIPLLEPKQWCSPLSNEHVVPTIADTRLRQKTLRYIVTTTGNSEWMAYQRSWFFIHHLLRFLFSAVLKLPVLSPIQPSIASPERVKHRSAAIQVTNTARVIMCITNTSQVRAYRSTSLARPLLTPSGRRQ